MNQKTTTIVKRAVLALSLLLMLGPTTAQNIDFNMTNRQDAEVNEPDYIS